MVLTKNETNRRHYLKHREKLSEQRRLYYKTPEGLKYTKINVWKRRGIIDEDGL